MGQGASRNDEWFQVLFRLAALISANFLPEIKGISRQKGDAEQGLEGKGDEADR